MIVNQNTWKSCTEMAIPYDEYRAIHKFIDQYREKEIIVADKYRVDFKRVPFENDRVSFTAGKEYMKIVGIKRRIVFNEKTYIVNLEFPHMNFKYDGVNCSPYVPKPQFEIKTSEGVNLLYLKNNDLYSEVVNVFDEKKIVSPENAYIDRIYVNKTLQTFINNHEWNKIIEGINQKKDLENALFIIDEPKRDYGNFLANFGTILYQLIAYRNEHENELSKKDLLGLDKAILELSKSELLKVSLCDQSGIGKSTPTDSILLDWYYNSSQTHASEQYNVDNGELVKEKDTLDKVIKKLKNN